MKIPKAVPEKGFYYHYKHDPKGPVNNYAYELVGVGCHTELNVNFAIYLPLYESASVYKAGQFFDVRPLDMWMEDIVKNGVKRPRFKRITDLRVIAELQIRKRLMYG